MTFCPSRSTKFSVTRCRGGNSRSETQGIATKIYFDVHATAYTAGPHATTKDLTCHKRLVAIGRHPSPKTTTAKNSPTSPRLVSRTCLRCNYAEAQARQASDQEQQQRRRREQDLSSLCSMMRSPASSAFSSPVFSLPPWRCSPGRGHPTTLKSCKPAILQHWTNELSSFRREPPSALVVLERSRDGVL